MQLSHLAFLSASFSSLASTFPVQHSSRDFFNPHIYEPPSPSDSRGPCPGLNTLANHGYINRNGRDISEASVFTGFLQAFGLNQSAVAPALPNSYHTCQYLTHTNCSAAHTLKNITLIAEPHTSEHDHSLSRQDYKMAYAHGAATDNYSFNATIFQAILDLIGTRTHVDYALANEIRLLRTSKALQEDQPGWLSPEEDIMPVQSFELGFIFAVMADRSLPDADTNPQIRVDWWHHWFQNEELPYCKGWTAPSPPREIGFVASAAGAIYASKPSATPSPLPSGALNAPGAPAELPDSPQVPILPLATPSPVKAPWPFGWY